MKTKLPFSIVCALIIALSACSSKLNTSSRQETRKVPISINLSTDNSINSTDLHPDLYILKIKDFLDDIRVVDLVLVEEDENAEVILDIDVKSFHIYPKKESSSTKEIKRDVWVGTDANGKGVYQTTTATVYSESASIRSMTRLSSKFTFKDPSYKVPLQNYFASYTWSYGSTSVEGDQRAINNSYSGRTQLYVEPVAEELLFQLSNRDMLRRISYDLRKYYQKLNN